MRKLTFLMACLFLIGVGLVNAQSKSISGKVFSSEDGQPIIGASIMVKGTTIGTITDIDGNFTITPPSSSSILWFSYVGMKTVQMEAKNGMIVKLESDALSDLTKPTDPRFDGLPLDEWYFCKYREETNQEPWYY